MSTEPQNYYRLTIKNFGEYFEFGNSVTEVIDTVRRDFELTARRAGLEPRPLGALSVRRAVYKEWNYSPEQYTNGGSFTHLYN